MIGPRGNFAIAVDALKHSLVSLVLIARLTQVVGLAAALRAKVILTLAASDSVQTHVDR